MNHSYDSLNICDHCKGTFPNDVDDVIVLICGHGFHLACYNVTSTSLMLRF